MTERSEQPPVLQPEAPPPPAAGWLQYQGQTVVVQLSFPYVAVTHPALPMAHEPGGHWIRMQVLRGVLHVRPDGSGGLMLILGMADPDPEKNARVFVVLDQANILACTATEALPEPPAT